MQQQEGDQFLQMHTGALRIRNVISLGRWTRALWILIQKLRMTGTMMARVIATVMVRMLEMSNPRMHIWLGNGVRNVL
jgi:hypothetical protein